MSRTARLFELLQLLRQHRRPVNGTVLAEKLGISLRTLYRDIKSLQAQGADIAGEAGIGYMLRHSFMLPPLMFSEEEIEALVLGSRWVADRADNDLQVAARNALSKIAAVLPTPLKLQLEASALLIAPGQVIATDDHTLAILRRAIRKEYKLELQYRDAKDSATLRIIWPLAIGFFDQVRVVIAWCELRQDFRHFRADRIVCAKAVDQPYAKRRQALLQQWHAIHGIPIQ